MAIHTFSTAHCHPPICAHPLVVKQDMQFFQTCQFYIALQHNDLDQVNGLGHLSSDPSKWTFSLVVGKSANSHKMQFHIHLPWKPSRKTKVIRDIFANLPVESLDVDTDATYTEILTRPYRPELAPTLEAAGLESGTDLIRIHITYKQSKATRVLMPSVDVPKTISKQARSHLLSLRSLSVARSFDLYVPSMETNTGLYQGFIRELRECQPESPDLDLRATYVGRPWGENAWDKYGVGGNETSQTLRNPPSYEQGTGPPSYHPQSVGDNAEVRQREGDGGTRAQEMVENRDHLQEDNKHRQDSEDLADSRSQGQRGGQAESENNEDARDQEQRGDQAGREGQDGRDQGHNEDHVDSGEPSCTYDDRVIPPDGLDQQDCGAQRENEAESEDQNGRDQGDNEEHPSMQDDEDVPSDGLDRRGGGDRDHSEDQANREDQAHHEDQAYHEVQADSEGQADGETQENGGDQASSEGLPHIHNGKTVLPHGHDQQDGSELQHDQRQHDRSRGNTQGTAVAPGRQQDGGSRSASNRPGQEIQDEPQQGRPREHNAGEALSHAETGGSDSGGRSVRPNNSGTAQRLSSDGSPGAQLLPEQAQVATPARHNLPMRVVETPSSGKRIYQPNGTPDTEYHTPHERIDQDSNLTRDDFPGRGPARRSPAPSPTPAFRKRRMDSGVDDAASQRKRTRIGAKSNAVAELRRHGPRLSRSSILAGGPNRSLLDDLQFDLFCDGISFIKSAWDKNYHAVQDVYHDELLELGDAIRKRDRLRVKKVITDCTISLARRERPSGDEGPFAHPLAGRTKWIVGFVNDRFATSHAMGLLDDLSAMDEAARSWMQIGGDTGPETPSQQNDYNRRKKDFYNQMAAYLLVAIIQMKRDEEQYEEGETA